MAPGSHPKQVKYGGVQGRTGRSPSPHKHGHHPRGILRGSRDREDQDAMDIDLDNDNVDQVSSSSEPPSSLDSSDQEALDAQLLADGLDKQFSKDKKKFSQDKTIGKGITSDDPRYIGPENNGKDEALFGEIEKLKKALDDFAGKHVPQIAVSKQKAFLDGLLINDNEELIRYIGCLVLGGCRGTWQKLLGEKESRKAIIIGVIAQALKEHVFGEYLFGGDELITTKLMDIDTSGQSHCGFERTRKRAELVNKYKFVEGALQAQIASVHTQLLKLLTPLWSNDLSSSKKDELKAIVGLAARTAELIRRAPDVVYYWPPTFKDEEFEPARMDASNLRQMIELSPYDKRKVGGHHRAVLKDPRNTDRTEAIVRIVAFPGIVAYRKFGGKLAEAEIAAEKDTPSHHAPEVRHIRDRYNRVVTPAQGFRSRLISKSVVYLEWGQQRLLTKEAGTSAHLDAVRNGKMSSRYDEDSAAVKELYDLYKQANQM